MDTFQLPRGNPIKYKAPALYLSGGLMFPQTSLCDKKSISNFHARVGFEQLATEVILLKRRQSFSKGWPEHLGQVCWATQISFAVVSGGVGEDPAAGGLFML